MRREILTASTCRSTRITVVAGRRSARCAGSSSCSRTSRHTWRVTSAPTLTSSPQHTPSPEKVRMTVITNYSKVYLYFPSEPARSWERKSSLVTSTPSYSSYLSHTKTASLAGEGNKGKGSKIPPQQISRLVH